MSLYNKSKQTSNNYTNINKGVYNSNSKIGAKNNHLNFNSKIGLNNAKDNKNFMLDKQRILGENKNINTPIGGTNKSLNENTKINTPIHNNDTSPDEINARLGRIQQLLDTAKI